MQHFTSDNSPRTVIDQFLTAPSNWDYLESACVALARQLRITPETIVTMDELDRWAHRVQCRVASDDTAAKLAHLHEVLFEEMNIKGNLQSYYVIENLLIDSVVQRREGMPVMLCLIYKRVADRLGLVAQGLNMPGHFLLRVSDPHGWLVVDPFCRGRVLDEEQAIQRLIAATQWSEFDLRNRWQAATPLAWLRRILLSLEHCLDRGGWYEKLDEVRSLIDHLPPEVEH